MVEITIFDEEENTKYTIESRPCPFCGCKKIEYSHEKLRDMADYKETIYCAECKNYFSKRYRDYTKRESVKLELLALWNQRA